MAFLETSAYSKTGIDEAFTTVLKGKPYEATVVDDLAIYELSSSSKLGKMEGVTTSVPLEKKTIKISLNTNFEEKKKKKCC